MIYKDKDGYRVGSVSSDVLKGKYVGLSDAISKLYDNSIPIKGRGTVLVIVVAKKSARDFTIVSNTDKYNYLSRKTGAPALIVGSYMTHNNFIATGKGPLINIESPY